MTRYLILIAIFGAGVWAIIFSFRPLENQERSETWLSTNATITSSEIEQFERTQKKTGSSGTEKVITYKPKLTYAYSVAGTTYSGDQLNFSSTSYRDKSVAEGIQTAYPNGASIDVFYNPQNPAESVLNREGEAITLLTYFGALLCLWSAWCLLKPIIAERRHEAKQTKTS